MQINKVISIKCTLFTDICGGYIAIYHTLDVFENIEYHFDIRERQQHIAFNRYLDGH